MTRTTSPAIKSILYADVERMLDKLVWQHIRRHGGEFDELRSIANLAFCEASDSFDPKAGAQFSSWIYQKVYYALLSSLRQTIRHQRVQSVDMEILDALIEGETTRPFCCIDLLRSLDDDAEFVIHLLLSAPTEDTANKSKRIRLWESIQEHLATLGWSPDRIQDSVDEIKQTIYT